MFPNEIWFNVLYHCDIESIRVIIQIDELNELITTFIESHTKVYKDRYVNYSYIDLANTKIMARPIVISYFEYAWWDFTSIKLDINYCNSTHGEYVVRDRHNQIMEESNYEYGLLQGIRILYVGNIKANQSALCKANYYKDGMQHGLSMTYNYHWFNDKMWKCESYAYGIKHGKHVEYEYSEFGTNIIKETRYDMGKVVKVVKY